MFLKIFEDSSLPGTLGIKFFRKICPKTRSKHVWILSGTILGIFDICEFCDFQESFRRLDPPWNTGHKNFQKIFPKTCSKHVWILLGTLLGIFGILNLLFLKIFENSTLHGTLGQKKISKNLPQNTFKTRLDTFEKDFGHFWNFEKKNLKIFENSTLHATPGINFFRKNHPKTRLDTFGNTFVHFLEI